MSPSTRRALLPQSLSSTTMPLASPTERLSTSARSAAWAWPVTCRRLNADGDVAQVLAESRQSSMRATVCLTPPCSRDRRAHRRAAHHELVTSVPLRALTNGGTPPPTRIPRRALHDLHEYALRAPLPLRLAEDDSSSKHRERRRYGVSASDVGHGESSRDDPAPPPSAVDVMDESGPGSCGASVADDPLSRFNVRNLIGVVVRLWGRAGGDGGRGGPPAPLHDRPDLSGRRRARCAAADRPPAPEPRLRGRPSGGARRSSALLPDDGRRRLRRGSGRRRERSAVASVVGGKVSFTAVVTSPPARDNIAAHDSRDRPVMAASCVTPTSPPFGSSLMARRRRARSTPLAFARRPPHVRCGRRPPRPRGARASRCAWSRVTPPPSSRPGKTRRTGLLLALPSLLAQLWARVGRAERRHATRGADTRDARRLGLRRSRDDDDDGESRGPMGEAGEPPSPR